MNATTCISLLLDAFVAFHKKLNHTSKLKVYWKVAMVHYCKSYLLHTCKPYASTPSRTTLLPSLQSPDGVSTSPSSPINDIDIGNRYKLITIVSKLWPSALIFHEWNKNCFLFIFIISNRIQFKWKIIKGFTKINIMSYHDMKKTWQSRNKLHIFLLHTKIKSMQ